MSVRAQAASRSAPAAAPRWFAPGRHRFALLLAALVVLLLLSPVLDGHPAGARLLTVLFTLVLLAAVLAASGRAWTLAVALALAAPWLYLSWLHPLWRADGAGLAADLLLVGLGLFVLALVLARVAAAPRVGADTLCGAVAAYLLIGVVWAVCYGVIEALVPGSFGLVDPADPVDPAGPVDPVDPADPADPAAAPVWNQLLYFSLVTLTTLGYGDISPVGAVARIWSALEAVAGTLYLALLIARLVSLYRR